MTPRPMMRPCPGHRRPPRHRRRGGAGAGRAGLDVTYTYRTAPVDDAAGTSRRLDLADRAAVDAFAQEQEDAPAWDAVVHVSGTTYDTLAAVMDQDAAEQTMQVNYWAFARIARAVVRPMLRARVGRIVVIGSVMGLHASQGNAAYGASKAALLSYVRTLAIESAKRGVTVNYVAPGFVDTEMMAPYAAYRARHRRPHPRRPLRPAGGDRRGRRIPGLAGGGLHQRRLYPGRWRADRVAWHPSRLSGTTRHDRRSARCNCSPTARLALVQRDAPPPPAPGEVQLRVRYVGLNHIDVWGFRGMAFAKRLFPLSVGAEAACEVVAVGDGVTTLDARRSRGAVCRAGLRHLPPPARAAATICARTSPACAASTSMASRRNSPTIPRA